MSRSGRNCFPEGLKGWSSTARGDHGLPLPESQQQELLDQLRDETTGEIYAFPVIEITDGTAVLRENVSVVTRVCGTPKTAIQYLMQVYYGTDS